MDVFTTKSALVDHCGKAICPNWDCKGREIETLITQDLFKEMDKPTTLTTEDTASKQVKMLAVIVILRHSVVCNRLQPTFIKMQKL